MKKLNDEALQLVHDLKHDFAELYELCYSQKPIDGCVSIVIIRNEQLASDLSKVFKEEREYTNRVIAAAHNLDKLLPEYDLYNIYGLYPFLSGTGFEYNSPEDKGIVHTNHHTLLTSTYCTLELNDWIDNTDLSSDLKELIKSESLEIYESHSKDNKNSLDYAYLSILDYVVHLLEVQLQENEPTQIQAYKCRYCGKLYERKHYCEKHEKSCYQNPQNKHRCLLDCKHLEKTVNDNQTSFKCLKTGKYLYSYKAEHNMHLNDHLKELGERMPLECNLYSLGNQLKTFNIGSHVNGIISGFKSDDHVDTPR